MLETQQEYDRERPEDMLDADGQSSPPTRGDDSEKPGARRSSIVGRVGDSFYGSSFRSVVGHVEGELSDTDDTVGVGSGSEALEDEGEGLEDSHDDEG